MTHYSILILSPISVYREDNAFYAMDLWARDLNTQTAVAAVQLICPVLKCADRPGVKLDPRIQAHSDVGLDDNGLAEVVSKVDIVQLPGHTGWTGSRLARRLLRIAKRLGKPVLLGVSSNRARTAWLNSSNKIKGGLRRLDIRSCQIWMAIQCDGVLMAAAPPFWPLQSKYIYGHSKLD